MHFPSPAPAPRRFAGEAFTLLELVVSMVLAAVMLLLTARVLQSAINVRTHLQDTSSDLSALRRVQ